MGSVLSLLLQMTDLQSVNHSPAAPMGGLYARTSPSTQWSSAEDLPSGATALGRAYLLPGASSWATAQTFWLHSLLSVFLFFFFFFFLLCFI